MENKRKRLSGGAGKKIKKDLTRLLQAPSSEIQVSSANQFENVEIPGQHHYQPCQTTVNLLPCPSTSSTQSYAPATIQNDMEQNNLEQNATLKLELCKWNAKYNITLSAMKDLLSILNNNVSSIQLPSDPRTLSSTPRKSTVLQNKFCYFGVVNCLNIMLETITVPNNVIVLNLTFFIDGVPLSKSSNVECWPTMFVIDEFQNSIKPTIASLFVDKEKPSKHYLLYFDQLVNELNDLIENGYRSFFTYIFSSNN